MHIDTHHKHHEHNHEHHHEHEHNHEHHHAHEQHHSYGKCHNHLKYNGKILILRPQSGISGDMLLSGLTRITNTSNEELQELYKSLNIDVTIDLHVDSYSHNAIAGYKATVNLPHEHAHRNLKDITDIINNSSMTDKAKDYALKAFNFLADAESKVHGKTIDEVHFHEVGALDSIVDTCICAMLFDKLNPTHFICGPLPIADGKINCAHGMISSPAPAVLHLLKDVKIIESEGKGEMVTPTAISLLKAFGANFGHWTQMTMKDHCIVYGSRIIPNIPNGAIFALGEN